MISTTTLFVIFIIIGALVICPAQGYAQYLLIQKAFDTDLNKAFVIGTSYVAFIAVDMCIMLLAENRLYALFGPHSRQGFTGNVLFVLITILIPYVLRFAVMYPFYFYAAPKEARTGRNALRYTLVADIVPSVIMLLIYFAL
jgi:hypothetical protein